MRNLIIIIILASLVVIGLISPARTETVTVDEALAVADNWIDLIIQSKGSWGGSQTAEVDEIREFKRRDRIIGYFCRVHPQGFIVTSLHKELAPVKAYSATGDLNPESEKGLADVIKGGMERVLIAIEQKVGPLESASSQEIQNILEINYRQSFEDLNSNVGMLKRPLGSGVSMGNYQEGQVLLSTSWHQGDPYNTLCPTGDTGCTDCCPDDPWICNPTLPTLVGCVATAGSQIITHWDWPPYGSQNASYTWDGDDSCDGPVGGGALSVTIVDTYDWAHMANRYVWNPWQNRWEDENGNPLTQAHLDAVAELCYEVGVAVEMDYGVCSSAVSTSDMEDVYENHYRYSTACSKENRKDYSAAVDWFNRMVVQFNANRPVHYRINNHSIVGDGWQVIGSTRQYHMNYGWDDSYNAWYTLDALYYPAGGSIDDEYMLENIYPAQAMGSSLSGIYSLQSFPYRYFDQDATGSNATFEAGQYLQFLPAITVACTGTTGTIRFEGSSALNSRLFTRGDASTGVRIYNGTIKLSPGGSIAFH